MASSNESGNSPEQSNVTAEVGYILATGDKATTSITLSCGIKISNITIAGLEGDEPYVQWPRSLRGLPIVDIRQDLRHIIEDAIFAQLVAEKRAVEFFDPDDDEFLS